MSSSVLSGVWLGHSGNINDPANYVGTSVFPIFFIPEGENAYSYVLSDFPNGPWQQFQQSPTGTVGAGSLLSFGAGAVVAGGSFGWTGPYMLNSNVSPAPPPAEARGVVVYKSNLPLNYKVDGDASVAGIAVSAGLPTFTGNIKAAGLIVSTGKTTFKGGSFTLTPGNAVPGGASGAFVDNDGTLVLTDRATASFAGAFQPPGKMPTNGLQVSSGFVLVTNRASLYAQGLDLGAIPGVTTAGTALLSVVNLASATIVADAQHTIDVGDQQGATGDILVNSGTLVLQDQSGRGITLGGNSGTASIDEFFPSGRTSIIGNATLGAGAAGRGAISLDAVCAIGVTGSLMVGDGSGSFGRLDVAQGGTATIGNGLIIGASGLGLVDITGLGSVLDVTGTAAVGSGAAGELLLSQGSLRQHPRRPHGSGLLREHRVPRCNRLQHRA